uniref:helix-turn-helix transcriptional regulator n=1 Tax=Roseovarius sp. BRH_c41 TaxID=1629709 RepID=UPI00345C561D
MNLDTYLKSVKCTQRQFAAKLNVSPSYLNEIVKGTKSPSLSLAIRIENETGGEVAVASLLSQQDRGAA